MLTVVGVSHGYQCVTEVWPPIAASIFPVCQEEAQYQLPFRTWLAQRFEDRRLVWVFEEWPLRPARGVLSSAELLTINRDHPAYAQVDPVERPFAQHAANDEWRENRWVEVISTSLRASGNAEHGIFIVGNKHVDSIVQKLRAIEIESHPLPEVELRQQMLSR